jgi:hypothetical protein
LWGVGGGAGPVGPAAGVSSVAVALCPLVGGGAAFAAPDAASYPAVVQVAMLDAALDAYGLAEKP